MGGKRREARVGERKGEEGEGGKGKGCVMAVKGMDRSVET